MSPAQPNPLNGLLADSLAPAAAPDALWDRVWQPRPARTFPLKLAVSGALAVAAVAVAIFVPGGGPHVLRSAHPAEIRAWVRNCAGLDVPLPEQAPPQVELVEARASEGSAQIVFKVEGRRAVLTAARSAGPASEPHTHPAGARAWEARGVSYSVSEGQAADACRLCHAAI